MVKFINHKPVEDIRPCPHCGKKVDYNLFNAYDLCKHCGEVLYNPDGVENEG